MPQENVVKPDQTVGQNDDPSACRSVSEESNGFHSSEKILLEPKSVQSPEGNIILHEFLCVKCYGFKMFQTFK